MKEEKIDAARLRRMEQRLGCKFYPDGTFAEMSIDLENYREKTQPIAGVSYGFYHGDWDALRRGVEAVDPEWVQYFGQDAEVFCGFMEQKLASFCLVDVVADSILSDECCRVGSIGCVGTLPPFRGQQIGLRMVDLATRYLKEQGCDKASVSYTHIDHWYRKLGYETFARFSFPQQPEGEAEKDYQELKKWLEETRDEPLEAMDAFFDRRIGDYEEHMAPWQRHYQWMAELLPEQTQKLLDIGCGSGLELDAIFRRFPELQVTGVDLAREMLEKLRRKHPQKDLELIQADYFVWEPEEERFDAAVSFETLHHFPLEEKVRLFRKLYRGLKPGGVYLECDYIAVSQAIEDLTFQECRRRRLRDGIAPETFVHFDTPLTLEHELQAIREGGFEEVTVVGFLPGDSHTPIIRGRKKGRE